MQKQIHDIRPWDHSTGPRTEEGKRQSSVNALKHGCYTKSAKARTKAFMNYMLECTQNPGGYETELLADKVCSMIINPGIEEVDRRLRRVK